MIVDQWTWSFDVRKRAVLVEGASEEGGWFRLTVDGKLIRGVALDAALFNRLRDVQGERGKLRSKLRILADGLFKAASGTLEGPDIEDLLEKAGLIEWVAYDSKNFKHTGCFFDFEVEDGDRIWLTTDFAEELLKHEDPQKGKKNAPHRRVADDAVLLVERLMGALRAKDLEPHPIVLACYEDLRRRLKHEDTQKGEADAD